MMNAKIFGEDQGVVGVEITDNNGIEHEIAMTFDGDIKEHIQDGYPHHPDDREVWEDETVAQVRRYAKWYVYHQRGYDTVPSNRNPDRIAGTLIAIRNMDNTTFNRHFGTLHEQVRSHVDDTVDRLIELVPEADPDQVVYKQDIHLAADIDDLRGLHERFVEHTDEDLREIVEEYVDQGIISSLSDLSDLPETVLSAASSDDSLPDVDVDVVSDLYYIYHRRGESPRTVRENHLDEEPDTTLDIIPAPPGSLKAFRGAILHHLMCQIRDTYLRMGVEPPEPYRLLGLGIHDYSMNYRDLDMYPDYFDVNAKIEGYVGL